MLHHEKKRFENRVETGVASARRGCRKSVRCWLAAMVVDSVLPPSSVVLLLSLYPSWRRPPHCCRVAPMTKVTGSWINRRPSSAAGGHDTVPENNAQNWIEKEKCQSQAASVIHRLSSSSSSSCCCCCCCRCCCYCCRCCPWCCFRSNETAVDQNEKAIRNWW